MWEEILENICEKKQEEEGFDSESHWSDNVGQMLEGLPRNWLSFREGVWNQPQHFITAD